MFEVIVVAICFVVLILLVRLYLQYRSMDDRTVLRYTSLRATFREREVSPERAASSIRRRGTSYRVVRDVFFLAAVALTVGTIYHIINTHPDPDPYLEITSSTVVVDTALLLGVLMIFSFWAVWIAFFYAGRMVVSREREVMEKRRDETGG